MDAQRVQRRRPVDQFAGAHPDILAAKAPHYRSCQPGLLILGRVSNAARRTLSIGTGVAGFQGGPRKEMVARLVLFPWW